MLNILRHIYDNGAEIAKHFSWEECQLGCDQSKSEIKYRHNGFFTGKINIKRRLIRYLIRAHRIFQQRQVETINASE
jgi:hypothetical protein